MMFSCFSTDVLPQRDEGSGKPCALIKPYSMLVPTQGSNLVWPDVVVANLEKSGNFKSQIILGEFLCKNTFLHISDFCHVTEVFSTFPYTYFKELIQLFNNITFLINLLIN